MAKLKSKSTHPWQQSLLDRYGPLKEIWLASYAPFYAFIVFRNRLDAQVSEGVSQQSVLPLSPCVRMPVPELTEPGSPDAE